MKALEIGDKIKFIDALMNNLTMYKFKIDNHEDLLKRYANNPDYDEFEFCYICYDNSVAFYEAHNYHAKPIDIHSGDIFKMELVVTAVDNTLLDEEY